MQVSRNNIIWVGLIFGSVVLLAVLWHFVIGPSLHRKMLIKTIENTDRIVVSYTYHEPSHKVSYVGEQVEEVLAAIKNSYRDNGVYDTPVTLHQVDFYEKDERIATIFTCSSLFIFEGKQYRDRSGALGKLVDSALRRWKTAPSVRERP